VGRLSDDPSTESSPCQRVPAWAVGADCASSSVNVRWAWGMVKMGYWRVNNNLGGLREIGGKKRGAWFLRRQPALVQRRGRAVEPGTINAARKSKWLRP